MNYKLVNTRKEMGLTQAEMAELIGISLSSYGKLERSERVGRLPTYKKIAEKTKKPIQDLI